jgi:tetratricopeptide (TPR) repeat protein
MNWLVSNTHVLQFFSTANNPNSFSFFIIKSKSLKSFTIMNNISASSIQNSNLAPQWADQERAPGFEMLPVNMLAQPKDVKLICEMTGAAATIQLITPYLTLYFATRTDAEIAWAGIFHKIIPLLGPIRSAPAVIGSEEERQRRQYTLEVSKRALIDLTKNEAANLLARGQYQLSIPGALQSMAFIKDVHGDQSVELVPAYLLLAEANLGLRRYKSAEEYLSLANWSVLQNPQCSNLIRSQLHRNFGKLYAGQGKHAEALDQLARDVYFSSLEVGPEHVDTAAGYFHMANIFSTQNKVEQGLAFYDKVVDIWYKFLANVRSNAQDIDVLGEAQIAEAMDMLKNVWQIREKFLGNEHIATGESRFTLGLLYLFVGETQAALGHISVARTIYTAHLGEEHPSTQDVVSVLTQLSTMDVGPTPNTAEGDSR